MLGALFLTLITTFLPARPTVGDPITIQFAAPTIVQPSADYEVVSQKGNAVVIRTFVPHTITVTGRSADGPVSVMIPIHSVLKPDDKLEPAPLKPPRTEPWPRLPFIAIAIAALAAIAAWTAVVLLAKRRVPKPRIVVVPSEEFRSRVLAVRADAPMRWARLADAVRAYLAAVRADLGAELTTSELLARIQEEEEERRRPAGRPAAGSAAISETAGEPPAVQPTSRRRYESGDDDPSAATSETAGEPLRLRSGQALAVQPTSRRRYEGGAAGDPALIAQILRQGDLEKFSPWGAPPADFEGIAKRALEIPAWAEPPAEQIEVAA